jgi:hypothetical protein
MPQSRMPEPNRESDEEQHARMSRIRRTPRTAGIARARKTFAAHALAERRGMPVEELIGESESANARARETEADGRLTRRALLLGGASALAGATLAAAPARSLAKLKPGPLAFALSLSPISSSTGMPRRSASALRSSVPAWPACAARTCSGAGLEAPR